MKRFLSLALALLMMATLAVAVSAHTSGNNWGDIPLYKGKITVDGVKDAIYDKGFTVNINNRTDGKTGGATGKAYMLWDGSKMYIFVEVTDADIVKFNASAAEHKNEGVEFTLDYSNAGSNRCKVCVNVGNNSANKMGDSPDGMYSVQCKTSAKGYNVELVCDLSKQNIQPVKFGVQYGINLLINDITGTDTRGIIRTVHKNNPTENETAKYDYITLSNKEVKIEAQTTKPAAQTQKPTSSTTAPATADVFTVIAVAAAASLSGVIVSKKRK
ncbi:MAG: hypothetical protein E7662_10240 [Ruminococcaceae bacterium]|nr:hypothetical protein [Oscillospiraceae bacterium]